MRDFHWNFIFKSLWECTSDTCQRDYNVPVARVFLLSIIAVSLCLGIAFLLWFHMYLILSNTTTIEFGQSLSQCMVSSCSPPVSCRCHKYLTISPKNYAVAPLFMTSLCCQRLKNDTLKVSPYNKGWVRNFESVFGADRTLWLIPIKNHVSKVSVVRPPDSECRTKIERINNMV